MLDVLDEILLEQYISCENLKKSDRDKCVHFIRNLKDVSQSSMSLNNNSNDKYEIVSIHFVKKGNKINFNGSLSGESEYRWIDGNITKRGNSIVVMSSFYRLSPLVEEDEKEYSTVDVYNFTKNGIKRKSAYVHDDSFSVDTVEFNDEELYNFYLSKIGKGPILSK